MNVLLVDDHPLFREGLRSARPRSSWASATGRAST